jgi:hypothetical protein
MKIIYTIHNIITNSLYIYTTDTDYVELLTYEQVQ